jgi:hypothetical protein
VPLRFRMYLPSNSMPQTHPLVPISTGTTLGLASSTSCTRTATSSSPPRPSPPCQSHHISLLCKTLLWLPTASQVQALSNPYLSLLPAPSAALEIVHFFLAPRPQSNLPSPSVWALAQPGNRSPWLQPRPLATPASCIHS